MDNLAAIAGIRVGHVQRAGRGWRTGTTVVLFPSGGAAGVDVRGGGPGTRETDLLRPENLVQGVHALCFSGGSAYGLSAADGVMAWLEQQATGYPVGPRPSDVVPIVPSAVIFDLGRAGAFANRPDAGFGYRAARRATRRGASISGAIGAGTGAVCGGLQGGVASACEQLVVAGSAMTVAALAVVNAVGSLINPATALPWELDGLNLRRPSVGDRRRLNDHLRTIAAGRVGEGASDGEGVGKHASLNTTIGVVVTDAMLSKAECHKLASVAHDGLARAIRPAHTLFDGDTIFAVATATIPVAEHGASGFGDPSSRAAVLSQVGEAGARCFARACGRAVIDATSRGGPATYRELCPSAFADGRP